MIGLFQFCLKLNKTFAKIIIRLCIKHELKKKKYSHVPLSILLYLHQYI